MKVLVTGAGGQLGRALTASCPPDVELTALDRRDLDLTDTEAVDHLVASLRPVAVINAAAYTAVDKAESEPAAAHSANAAAPAALAAVCAAQRVRLVHVSTDFVFDGGQGKPYTPSDATAPLGVYGATKAEGERRIAATPDLEFRIVRTGWVYGPERQNFMLTMLRLFRERPEVRIVSDQMGTPTSVLTLAPALWWLARDAGPSGILHFSDAGAASWYDFALAIYEEAVPRGLAPAGVVLTPIATRDFPTPARRPSYGILDKSATWARYPVVPLHWRVALRHVLEKVSS